MHLTIIAATGGVGRELLTQAIEHGHEVTAIVRDPSRLPAGVRGVQCDLAAPDQPALDAALAHTDVVLSCLGARTATDTGVAERGTEAIIRAMRRGAAKRLVVISAAPVSSVPSPSQPSPPQDPGDNWAMRWVLGPIIRVVLRKHYADLARMEGAVRGSGLDWTIVRPPQLVDRPRSGEYRTAEDRNVWGGMKISRADVADVMLRIVEQPEAVGRTLGIAY